MKPIALCAWLCLLLSVSAPATPPAVPLPGSVALAGEEVSEAELLLRIRQSITDDLARANLLRIRGRYLEREFEAATATFDALDAALQSATAAAVPAAAAGSADAEATTADIALASPADPTLDDRWQRSRDLLDILLHRRQSIEQQLAVLAAKRETYEGAAEFVSSGQLAPDAAASTPGSNPEAAPQPAAPAAAEPDAATPTSPLAAVAPAAQPTPAAPMAPQPQVYDRRVAHAERELERVHTALRMAEHTVRITEELISLNQDERALVESAALLADRHASLLAGRAEAMQLPSRSDAAPDPVLADARVQALVQRAARATQAVAHDRERMAELERRLLALKELRAGAQDALFEREGQHETARRRLAFLQSPLAPHRLWNWVLQAMPRIVLLLGMFALVWVVGRWLARRIVDAAVTRMRRTANEERVQRVQTLRRALRSVLTVVLTIVVALIVLPEFGIDATVLLGSAAVLSLALAFGAQSLIKDYFSGFMLLSENQYRIGNVVRINDTAGVVEDISLRMTMLRDVEGTAHFIPHSEIRGVSNMSHGWAQAVADVRVGYDEDLDAVMRALEQVAIDMHADAEMGPLIAAAPEVWGVEELGESSILVRLVVRTRPLRQWQVKRELLRRIKNRFDALGIAFPLPRLSVRRDHDTLSHPASPQ